MKEQSNEMPLRIHDLGDGKSHFNHNVVEGVDEDGNILFTYDQVAVNNPVTRDGIVVSLIREQYSMNDEVAILRQKDINLERFETYFDFVESCKLIADEYF